MGRTRAGVVVAGFLACAAYAVVGSLQILVWNPLAVVPGRELEEIYRLMADAREPMAVALVLIWAALGLLLGASVSVASTVRRYWTTQQVLVLYLGVLVLGGPSYAAASFNPGMSMADAFMTHGGDRTPWGLVLCSISVAALLALVGLGCREALRKRLRTRPATP